ncbi:tRNA epoxyqueuosine(34) reductase QueG, partial [Salmonella enterica subsp. enterica serovar Poona]
LTVHHGAPIRRKRHLRRLRNAAVALGNAPWSNAVITALESRKGEHPLLDEHIEWAIAQQIEKRNACIIEVQLPKKQRLVRVIEKGLVRDA